MNELNSQKSDRNWRWLKLIGWALVWVVTLGVLAYAFENWRGHRAWAAYVAEVEARGDSLTLDAIIPPPVPDERNFAATPLLQKVFQDQQPFFELRKGEDMPRLGDWRRAETIPLEEWAAWLGHSGGPEDVLRELERFQPELDELRAAAKRPESRFPVQYELGVGAAVPHINVLRSGARICALKASAELEQQRPEPALNDILLGLRMASSLRSEPLLISLLVENAILETMLNPIWQGISGRAWNADQLEALDAALAEVNLAAHWQIGIRGERNVMTAVLTENFRKEMADAISESGLNPRAFGPMPAGWIAQNRTYLARIHDRLAGVVVPETSRFLPAEMDEVEREFWDQIMNSRTPYNVFAALVIPAVTPIPSKLASVQTAVHLARTAIALERHRLLHAAYPERLAQLDPAALASGDLPSDPVTGDSFRYARKGGSYSLYSVGWNGSDDGGAYALKDDGSGRIDFTEGDWSWPGAL